MQKELIYDSLTFVRGVYACQTNKLFCKHLGVVISRVCEDFLCQALGNCSVLVKMGEKGNVES